MHFFCDAAVVFKMPSNVMKCVLIIIGIFSCTACFQNGVGFERDFYERVSRIKFPTKYKVLETFDNGEWLTGTVLRIDSSTLSDFVVCNHFDTLHSLNKLHLFSQAYLVQNKLILTNTNNVFFLTRSQDKNEWTYIADLNSRRLWAEIIYPD